jgi:hypothetical protein
MTKNKAYLVKSKAANSPVKTTAFESNALRFIKPKKTDIGPGKYSISNGFTETNLNKKPNPICSKSQRFISFNHPQHSPGPGSYNIRHYWHHSGFTILNIKG